MDIQELDKRLKAQGKVCSGKDCIYMIELPGGSMWTRDFKTYTLHNKIRGEYIDVNRNDVMQGLATLGMNETQQRDYVRTQQTQQQQKKEFNTGLITIGVVAVGIVLIILITS